MKKITITVIPNSKKAGIVENNEGWKACLISPAKENKANKELVKLLARYLKIPLSKIVLISGEKSRQKTVLVSN